MTDNTLGRRNFLRATGGIGAVAAMSGGLAACGGGNSKENTKKTNKLNAAAKLPSYIARTVSKPDLVPTSPDASAGYLHFPSTHPASVAEKVGDGSTVSTFTVIDFAIPPGPGKNKYWSGLNERLNVNLKVGMTPGGEFGDKFATLIAGDSLPDIVELSEARDLPQLLQKKFTPLSEFLSGDAVKDYPNLANIPSTAWRSCVYSGEIFGVPVPRAIIGYELFARKDIFDQLGVPAKFGNATEFHDVCKEVTDPKAGRWAWGVASPLDVYLYMLGVPNDWAEKGGKLTNRYETDEMRKALDLTNRMWKEGLIYPDAFSSTVQFKQLIDAGKCVMAMDNYPAWQQYEQDNAKNPGFALSLITIPGFNGGKGTLRAGNPLHNVTGFRKTDDKDRIRMLLRICNWLAAPFGSKENYYRLFGIEGVHHTIDKNGDPQYTDVGLRDTVLPVRYICESPQPTYYAGHPDDVRTQFNYENAGVRQIIPDPIAGLYSAANSEVGDDLDHEMENTRNDVLQGHKSLKDWDNAVADWRKKGGDKIRGEFEAALQQKPH